MDLQITTIMEQKSIFQFPEHIKCEDQPKTTVGHFCDYTQLTIYNVFEVSQLNEFSSLLS